MRTRDYNFNAGIQTATVPTPTTPSGQNDFVNLAYADKKYGTYAAHVNGSYASPTLLSAGTALVPADVREQVWFVKSSGGAVTVSANPQIAAGYQVGDLLLLVGCSDTDTITYSDGTGCSQNGPFTLKDKRGIEYVWLGSTVGWWEKNRREN